MRRLKEFLLIKESKPLLKLQAEKDFKVRDEKKTSEDFVSPIPITRVHDLESENKGAIVFDNATGAWVSEEGESTVGLSAIDLKVAPGSLYAIVGSVGSGKTSLLHAILGELELDSGSLQVHGALSYANQESFIFEGSIRSNILFTEEYDEKRFSEVVSVCGLIKDFDIFEHGDQTLVGERGISLSGGQKARINLARAVYKNADIYLLDDPLSAVDSHVGKNIFKECILKFLKDKTVLLVTHQIQHLSKMQNILVMSNGQIKAQGSHQELEKMDLPLLMPTESLQNDKNEIDDKILGATIGEAKSKENDSKPEEQRESQEGGTVSVNVYKKYFQAIKSIPLVIFVLSLRVINQSIASFLDYFVAQWVNWEESIKKENATALNSTESSQSNDETRQSFVNFYIVTIVVFIVVILNAEFSFFYSLIR